MKRILHSTLLCVCVCVCVIMALEWEQFDSILQHEQLDSILNNQPFIVSFLDQLYTVK